MDSLGYMCSEAGNLIPLNAQLRTRGIFEVGDVLRQSAQASDALSLSWGIYVNVEAFAGARSVEADVSAGDQRAVMCCL